MPAENHDGMVVIRYSHEFPFGAQACFDWLTDYSEEDPSLTSAIIKERRVLERSADRVVMEVRNDVMGRGLRGKAEVRLFPDELRYEARSLHGDGGAVLYTYRLTPINDDRTRLDVAYGSRIRKRRRRLALHLARPLIHRQLRKMWDGFEASMVKDLA